MDSRSAVAYRERRRPESELREWDDAAARRWSRNLEPLEESAAERIRDWLPKLAYPIRAGEHSQSAFAFGLILDWARIAGDKEMKALLSETARRLYAGDRACPRAYEPSGQDFLSPCLAEADLMRRVLGPAEYADWLESFLPGIPPDDRSVWLVPASIRTSTLSAAVVCWASKAETPPSASSPIISPRVLLLCRRLTLRKS